MYSDIKVHSDINLRCHAFAWHQILIFILIYQNTQYNSSLIANILDWSNYNRSITIIKLSRGHA